MSGGSGSLPLDATKGQVTACAAFVVSIRAMIAPAALHAHAAAARAVVVLLALAAAAAVAPAAVVAASVAAAVAAAANAAAALPAPALAAPALAASVAVNAAPAVAAAAVAAGKFRRVCFCVDEATRKTPGAAAQSHRRSPMYHLALLSLLLLVQNAGLRGPSAVRALH